MKIDEGTMARSCTRFSEFFAVLLLVAHLEQLVLHNRATVVEGVTEDRFEKCCGLGTSWAAEGLRCEQFTGPVPGVPAVEQGPCQKAVDICCVRKYHDLQCEKGKADARQGFPCVSNMTATRKRTKITNRSDYHRDCCEGCTLGIYAASTNQGCGFKRFSFGIPWDPAFQECCHENLPSTTTDFTSPSTTDTDFSSSPSSPYSSSESSSSPYSSPLSSLSTSSSSPSSNYSSSTSSSSPSSDYSSSTSSSESTPYSIPTPELDDICQLMKGMLCSDICVPTPGSYYCKCRDGFTLLEDGKTCSQDPTDRCKSTHPCEHICTDNGEAVICSCNPGYDLAGDRRSCILKTTKNKKSTDAADKDNVSLCPPGYRFDAIKQLCNDIDECAEGLDTCGDEICYNQPGSYSCATPPAPITRKPSTPVLPTLDRNQRCFDGTRYVRNRGCVDINECKELEDACSSNEECINTLGSYICTCKTGFRRDNLTQACVDINECQLQQNDCLPTQRCDNTIGSYTCTRFLPCGTGYTLNAATEICEDDDECILGTHDCSGGYQCRNTLGSYRCDRIPRISTPQSRTSAMSRATMITTTTPITTTTTTTLTSLMPIDSRSSCPLGFESGSGGKCIDIDECRRTPNICGRQSCINTLGSHRCVSRVICPPGYSLDPVNGQHCIDIDECREGTHDCIKGQTCENRPGGYHCLCPAGYVDGPNKDCIDIDECSVYGSRICGLNSRCENTAGSFRCLCEEGFENNKGGGFCSDIDECERIPGLCQHVCLNIWGSYRCGCNSGYRLNTDNRSCSDIDECTEFKNNNLCIGICENTPGSYVCKCPDGYRLGSDGRSCQDIDECATGEVCRHPDETCQNTRGSHRCNKIICPTGYHRDSAKKNRCVRALRSCPWGDLACVRSPLHYSYNFITFVSMLPIPNSGQLELFTMRGNHHPDSTIQFTMALINVRAAPDIARATESCFNLRKPSPSQAVLVLTRSIQGPQEIELDLSMEIYHESKFVGSAVAKIIIFVSQYEF